MKKQKAMSQMKGQDKTPEKQLNEVEIGNLSEKEFRIMIVKMTQDLGEKNGDNDWEDAGNVCQRPRRTKGQINRGEENTRRDAQQGNWGRRRDSWAGGQKGGNHSTEQNMENNAEMKTASEASGATVNAPTSH